MKRLSEQKQPDKRIRHDELPFEPAGLPMDRDFPEKSVEEAPELEMPEDGIPELEMPEDGIPELEMPEDGIPELDAPDNRFPDEAGDRSRQPTSVGLPDVRPIAVMPGCLYVVGTPIGNLGDLSPRGAAVLAAVDRIAAEDTRHTLRLLNALGIRKPLVSYHEHNRHSRGPELVGRLAAGEAIALVSDAGMPSISDPGEDLVRLCVERGMPVTVIPGPTAAMTALAMSGLPTDRFVFEGFLPASGPERRQRLAVLAAEPRTLILYEAPHRLKKLLSALSDQGLGDRRVALGRELTKRFEEMIRTTVAEALASCGDQAPRGEYVVILEGCESHALRVPQPAAPAAERQLASDRAGGGPGGDNGTATEPEAVVRALLIDLLKQGLSVKDAAREASRRTGLKRSDLYARAQALKAQAGDGV